MSHAKLSPSASSRWLGCPASVGAIDNLGPIEYSTSFAAEEGTTAHALGEKFLAPSKWDSAISTAEGEVCEETGIAYNSEMSDHIETYRNYVKGYCNEDGSDLYLELRMPLFYSENESGTSDVVCYNEKTKTLHIIDLKYGRGIVAAHENTQLIIYAICAFKQFEVIYDIEKIECHIVQPRRNHFDSYEMTVNEAGEWEVIIDEQAELIMSGDAYREKKFGPSDKACQWCPLAGGCKYQANSHFEELDMELTKKEEQVLPNPDSLTMDQVSIILSHQKGIENWLKQVHAVATGALTMSQDVPGYKLVQTTTNRKWNDEAGVEKLLMQKFKQSERYISKLVSPAQADKLVKAKGVSTRWQKLLDGFSSRSQGKPAMVPESDKRPAISNSIEDEFSGLNDEFDLNAFLD